MGAPTEVRIELTHPQQLARADYLNLDACFSVVADDGALRKFSGYIERFSTVQTTKDYVRYEFVLKSHFGRLQAVTDTHVYQRVTTPQILTAVVRRHGIRDHPTSFRLRRQYPVHLW
ncbi:contractile injection system protein, VgrG/Pvc8 family, partial [Paraburkholderia sp. SIMBA_053]|uniref:contractile injection system protein, VgrG/Pvc8 family n=1 Tax=Paraburkholderia sp. SIMBA_053 TaxID=3085794 RepID=UPI00397D928B